MQSIEAVQQKTRIIAVNVTGSAATVINKLQKLTDKFSTYQVTQLRVLTRSRYLTKYTSAGITQDVLQFDDIKKIALTLHRDKSTKLFIDLAATSLSDEINNKARFNCNASIDFFNSSFRISEAISSPGWLLIQFSYK